MGRAVWWVGRGVGVAAGIEQVWLVDMVGWVGRVEKQTKMSDSYVRTYLGTRDDP